MFGVLWCMCVCVCEVYFIDVVKRFPFQLGAYTTSSHTNTHTQPKRDRWSCSARFSVYRALCFQLLLLLFWFTVQAFQFDVKNKTRSAQRFIRRSALTHVALCFYFGFDSPDELRSTKSNYIYIFFSTLPICFTILFFYFRYFLCHFSCTFYSITLCNVNKWKINRGFCLQRWKLTIDYTPDLHFCSLRV